MEPREFLRRLAAVVPAPGPQMTRSWWVRLLFRIFLTDVLLYSRCGGRRKVLAFLLRRSLLVSECGGVTEGNPGGHGPPRKARDQRDVTRLRMRPVCGR
ncbi:MAG: hypothetical protein R3E12_04360 [Candidatus Eisenbacteria bacterium]|uniref:Uncharacterized protein n=1 Tax=Eiseniibacteriota bacterium TaxID=2212470 RepID=A0A956M1B1_UNCEI|nr:hypothetical protein [Candidatus Eisenbacteria bacterium]